MLLSNSFSDFFFFFEIHHRTKITEQDSVEIKDTAKYLTIYLE
jgi:hypothetical protein